MRRLIGLVLLVGCNAPGSTDDNETNGFADDVIWSTDPDPVVAGATSEFQLQVVDDQGRPVGDLQSNHERMVHTLFISADLRTFRHLHQEDTAPVTAEDLRSASFRFPLELPTAGEHLVVFDYAQRNLWMQDTDRLVVEGGPAQADEPDLEGGNESVADDLRVTLTWTTPAVAGVEAAWEVEIVDATSGDPVTDLVPHLGTDAHCMFVTADLAWALHTHAWLPGMGTMSPSMEMPHAYDGPKVEFRDTFPVGGAYRMWVQFTRAADPSHVYTATFPFEVDG